MSFRPDRVANEIKKVLAQPIIDMSKSIKAGFATLTSVRISKDLLNAKIYISLYGSEVKPSELLAHLENNRGELRYLLGKKLRLKSVPDLKFFLDDTLDQIDHIQSILDSAKSYSDNDSQSNAE